MVHSVPINKGETALKWTWGAGGEARRGSSWAPCQSQEELGITGLLQRKKSTITGPTGRDRHCVSYKRSTSTAARPVRNPHCPGLLLASNGPPLKTAPSTHNTLLLHKITFLSCICWTHLVSPTLQSSAVPAKKPIIASQIIGSFIFDVPIPTREYYRAIKINGPDLQILTKVDSRKHSNLRKRHVSERYRKCGFDVAYF